MTATVYAPDLVEEAVLLAERTLTPREALAFRRERNRVYGVADPDRREAEFHALHLRWFARLGLHTAVEQTLAARREMLDAVSGCRVSRAFSRREEGADLIAPPAVESEAGENRPALALRLRPATLLDPAAIRACLRHELMHVADMLDPAFGYERALPPSEDGPAGDNILRDRYRVLWDISIDGRLARSGEGDDHIRAARAREFAITFKMLGDRAPLVFDEWFDRVRPTHAALVALALAPNGARGVEGDPGRCPLCRLPAGSLAPHPERAPEAVRALIRAHHPRWRIEQGLCAQCLDLYGARHEEAAHVSR